MGLSDHLKPLLMRRTIYPSTQSVIGNDLRRKLGDMIFAVDNETEKWRGFDDKTELDLMEYFEEVSVDDIAALGLTLS